jgi:hypothetical protein
MVATFIACVNVGRVKSCHFVKPRKRKVMDLWENAWQGLKGRGFLLKGFKAFCTLKWEVEEERELDKKGGARALDGAAVLNYHLF